MAANYLISRKWSLANRFTITDGAGVEQFSVEGPLAFSGRLAIRDSSGVELAVITRRGFVARYEILARGQLTTVRARGVFGQRFEIDSAAAGQLEARGNFSGRQYVVTRGGSPAAAVNQLRTFREQFAIEVSETEDPVLMLAVVLVIETIRDDRRRSAAAAGAAAAST